MNKICFGISHTEKVYNFDKASEMSGASGYYQYDDHAIAIGEIDELGM